MNYNFNKRIIFFTITPSLIIGVLLSILLFKYENYSSFLFLFSVQIIIYSYSCYKLCQLFANNSQPPSFIENDSYTESKAKFLTNITHELRTPLNGIIGFTQQIKKTQLTLVQKDYLSTIEKSACNLLSIINDILDFSKLNADKLTLEIIPFNLQQILYDVIRLNSAAAHEKGLDITLQIDSNIPNSLIGDPLRLQQILTNLIGNAIKFTKIGNVDIKVQLIAIQQNSVEIEFSIKDTGIGISKEQQQKLFNAFEQADASIARSYGGSGLGLIITKKLIEKMQGNIILASNLHQGTNVLVNLNLSVSRLNTCQKITTNILAGKKIIVVEPNTTYANILKHQLHIINMQTKIVNSVKDISDNCDYIILGISPNKYNTSFSKIMTDISILSKFTSKIILTLPTTELVITEQLVKLGIPNCYERPLTGQFLIEALLNASNINPIQNPPENHSETFTKSAAKILVVDDNLANLKLMQALLTEHIENITLASSGQEALDFANNNSFDMIFMDIQMPIMDGIETSYKIRTFSKNKTTPIIAVTAHIMESDKEKLQLVNINDYLLKPIDESLLLLKLKKWDIFKKPVVISAPKTKDTKDKHIDWSLALKNCANKPKLAQDLLVMLIDSFCEVREQIELSFINNEHDLLPIIHKLHGSCAYCGVYELKKLCLFIENKLKSGFKIKSIEPELLELLDELNNIEKNSSIYLEKED